MRKINIKCFSVLIALFSLIFSSCSDLLNADNSTTLSVSIENETSRNVLPDTTISNFSDFKLEGTLGEETQVLGTWSNYEDLSADSINIAYGTWSLTLTAKRNNITFTNTKSDVNILRGENNSVAFSLAANANTPGKAKIKLTYPNGSGVNRVVWSITSTADSTNVINGTCTSSGTDTYQSITSSAFNLEKELTKGNYILSCSFYKNINDLLGNYSDFIILEPGLESKLEYEITYFEVYGIQSLECTDNGIKIVFTVPGGLEQADVYRYELDSNGNRMNNKSVLQKYYGGRNASKETLTGYDCYEYVRGHQYFYYVVLNWGSSVGNIHSIIPQNDGWEMPEFSVYPEFSTVENENGITTQLKLSNTARMNWKGHHEDWDFSFNINYESSLYPWFSQNGGTCDVTSLTSRPGEHHPTSCYISIGGSVDDPGVRHGFNLNLNALTGNARLPVLHGPSLESTAQAVTVWKQGDNGFDSSSLNISDGTYTIVTDASVVYKVATVATKTYIINWCDDYNRQYKANYTIENDNWSGFVDARISLLNGDGSNVSWSYSGSNRNDENDDATPISFTGTGNPVYIRVNSAKCAFRVWALDTSLIPSLTPQASANGIQLTLRNIPANATSVTVRRNKRNSDRVACDSYIEISNPGNATFTINDYFVKTGVEYVYYIESIPGASFLISVPQNVVATSGYGELAISNSPVATYDATTKKLTFTTEPEFTVESLRTTLAALCTNYQIVNHFLYGKGENPNSFYTFDYDFNNAKTASISWFESGDWHLHERYDSIVYFRNNNQTVKYCYGTDLSVLFPGMAVITIQ